MKSAFAPFDERLLLINTVLQPGIATARDERRLRPAGDAGRLAEPRPSVAPARYLRNAGAGNSRSVLR
jgi:hypothetical protein